MATKKSSGAAKKSAATKSTAKKKATSKKAQSPFDTKFLEKMRKLLLQERETYLRQATNLKAEADSLRDSMEPGDVNFDEEGGEGDTIAVERERDLALSAKAREMIEEIDHAMAKFDNGTYGICEVSGEPIPKARLEALPYAREKVEYKVGGFPDADTAVVPPARRVGRIVLVATTVLVLDQATKWWAVNALGDGEIIDIVGSLRFRLVRNFGASFSSFEGQGPLISVLAVGLTAFLLWHGRKQPRTVVHIGYGAVIGGAIGNVLDRLFRPGDGFLGGGVIDFVDVQFWPVWNVADMAVVGAAILLFLLSFFDDTLLDTDDPSSPDPDPDPDTEPADATGDRSP